MLRVAAAELRQKEKRRNCGRRMATPGSAFIACRVCMERAMKQSPEKRFVSGDLQREPQVEYTAGPLTPTLSTAVGVISLEAGRKAFAGDGFAPGTFR
jgi:hypothetical protein